jgi:two-component system, LytTR family, response regulator
MNNVSCIIIDDEASGRIVLKELIAKYYNEIKVIGEANNIEEAFEEINSKNPDFIFLDIQMPGGNGFELLKKFKDINFEVIFTTSYEKYAMNAIKFSALDYLLKPIDLAELKTSIEKIKKIKKNKIDTQLLMINLLDNIDESNTEKKIAVHYQDKVKFIKLSDVICFEAESNYTHIYTNEEGRFTPARLLKDFEEYLAGHANFIRINKSIIINLNYVTEYSKGEPCFIYMKNGKEYEIARRKKAELAERMKK